MSSSRLQLRHALLRLGEVLRSESWREPGAGSLHPAQARIVRMLASRPSGLGVGAIAAELGVRQPTATRSLNALTAKGLVEKSPGAGRALAVRLTDAGRAWLDRAGEASVLDAAIDALSPAEQADFLATSSKMIRTLQVTGAISPQRLCVTCAYFQPHAHGGADAPHHCALINAAFGDRDLRLDCGEHQSAPQQQADQAWSRWTENRTPRQL